MYLTQIVKVANSAAIAAEFVENNYEGLLERYMLEDGENSAVQGEIVGTEKVDTVMWMADCGEMRCYTHNDVQVLRDCNGKLWITEEQESELFL